MMNLAEYRRYSQNLADFLPWAALVANGGVLNKNGSFQRSARLLVAITSRLSNSLRRLGDF